MCFPLIRLEVEKEFNIPLYNPTTNDLSPYNVKGVIDAIFRVKKFPQHYYYLEETSDRFLGPHKYVIIDWKSYLNSPNQVTIERCLQNAIYKWAALKAGYILDLNETECYLGILFKKKTPIFKAYRTPITNNLIRQALKILNDTILLIQLGIAMPNYNSIHCSYCEYYDSHCQTSY